MKSLTDQYKESLLPIKYCLDLSPYKKRLFSVYNAYNERSENVLNEAIKDKMKIDGVFEQQLIDAKTQRNFNTYHFLDQQKQNKLLEMAMDMGRFWENGRTLKVRFLGGNDFVHQKVKKYAQVWEKYANIHFEFVTSGDAEIRISFQQGKGSWSYIGTGNLDITDQTQPTMNFGWFNYLTPEEEFSGTILHEFGHALGCIHEHQSPAIALDWNKPKVYEEMEKSQNWSKEKVDHNVFNKYDAGTITNSVYDPTSIMHYFYPKEFFLSGSGTPWNTELSKTDIEFINAKYPKV